MTDHLTSRAQRLIDEFDKGRDTRHGIAKVLRHLEGAYGDLESWTLVKLAEELTAPTLLDRAMAGDRMAARQFLQQMGVVDANGQLTPMYQ